MKSNPPNILIVGIGNPICSDDGIGAYICQEIEQRQIPGVTTAIYHQLHTELVEEFLKFDIVIIADASATSEDVGFYLLQDNLTTPVASSHHVNASLLKAIADSLYHRELNLMICAVPGGNFEIGESL